MDEQVCLWDWSVSIPFCLDVCTHSDKWTVKFYQIKQISWYSACLCRGNCTIHFSLVDLGIWESLLFQTVGFRALLWELTGLVKQNLLYTNRQTVWCIRLGKRAIAPARNIKNCIENRKFPLATRSQREQNTSYWLFVWDYCTFVLRNNQSECAMSCSNRNSPAQLSYTPLSPLRSPAPSSPVSFCTLYTAIMNKVRTRFLWQEMRGQGDCLYDFIHADDQWLIVISIYQIQNVFDRSNLTNEIWSLRTGWKLSPSFVFNLQKVIGTRNFSDKNRMSSITFYQKPYGDFVLERQKFGN